MCLMAKGFDIGKYANQLARASVLDRQVSAAVSGDSRDIETITAEILQLKEDAGNAILGIGQRLIEAKAMLSHGEWLPWLTERVEFSERAAQRFMKLAREWSNPTVLSDLGATKALTLLALPAEEREQFMAENNVVDMTSRELERAIRERDEARQAAEAARAEAQTAEESRARMALDMAALEAIRRAAQESSAQAREALEQARAELQALREKPVEVAVETVVDQEAVERARAAAIREMQAKVDKAEAASRAAEEQRKAAEAAMQKAEVDTATANAIILSREAELAEVRRQLEEAAGDQKRPVVYATEELASFKLLFDQTKEAVNKLQGLLLKVRGRGDKELAEKLKAALLALSDAVRGCVE